MNAGRLVDQNSNEISDAQVILHIIQPRFDATKSQPILGLKHKQMDALKFMGREQGLTSKLLKEQGMNFPQKLTRRIQPPQYALEPKHRVSQRKILRWRNQREPNPFQPVRCGEQLVVGDVNIVVPDETGVPHRLVNKNDGGDQ